MGVTRSVAKHRFSESILENVIFCKKFPCYQIHIISPYLCYQKFVPRLFISSSSFFLVIIQVLFHRISYSNLFFSRILPMIHNIHEDILKFF